MYFYYFLATIGKKPKWDVFVTILQITQFIFDLSIFGYALYIHVSSGYRCSGDVKVWVFGAVILSTFLLLFVKMFIERYVLKKPAHAAGQHKEAGKHN